MLNGGAPAVAATGRAARHALAVIAAAALSACNLGPYYHRPETPVPAEWRERAGESAAWPAADWWRAFRSAELDDYIARARRANNDLAAAIARVREADALARVAGAPLLPAVGATATALTERTQATNSSFVNFRQFSPQLSVSYLLDFWGKNLGTQEAAAATARASRHDAAVVELTVESSVALSYFQSMELGERLAVAQGDLESAQTTLRGLRLQLKAGIATGLDVAQQETTVASLAAAIPPLQQQLRQSVHALAILVGETPESIETPTANMDAIAIPDVRAGLPSELLARRPDVAESEDQLVAANANIRVARASFFPSIELTASGGYASSALSTMLHPASRVHELAGGLTQPIFDNGALFGQYDYAKARYDELAATYRKAVLTALGEVEDSLVAVQQTAEQARRQDAAVAAARHAYEIAQAQLRSGTVSILTVLNTETALFAAQDARAQARYAQVQAIVGLYGALGGGWQASGS